MNVTCYVSDGSADSGLINMFCIADVEQKITSSTKKGYTKNLLKRESTPMAGDVWTAYADIRGKKRKKKRHSSLIGSSRTGQAMFDKKYTLYSRLCLTDDVA